MPNVEQYQLKDGSITNEVFTRVNNNIQMGYLMDELGISSSDKGSKLAKWLIKEYGENTKDIPGGSIRADINTTWHNYHIVVYKDGSGQVSISRDLTSAGKRAIVEFYCGLCEIDCSGKEDEELIKEYTETFDKYYKLMPSESTTATLREIAKFLGVEDTEKMNASKAYAALSKKMVLCYYFAGDYVLGVSAWGQSTGYRLSIAQMNKTTGETKGAFVFKISKNEGTYGASRYIARRLVDTE